LEWNKDYSKQDPLPVAPDQPVVVMNQPDNRVVSLLSRVSHQIALLELPIHFAAAFVRLLVRLLTHESRR
jgi:hypothetical protein